MDVYVLFRFSKKTGKADTTMTSASSALMKLWAMQNTTKSKQTVIFNRDTGACVFSAIGADGMPEIDREDLGTCEDYNIPLDILQSITDDRFDK